MATSEPWYPGKFAAQAVRRASSMRVSTTNTHQQYPITTSSDRGQILSYYNGNQKKGDIDISNSKTRQVDSLQADGKSFAFEIELANERLLLAADNDDVRQKCIVIFELAAKSPNWVEMLLQDPTFGQEPNLRLTVIQKNMEKDVVDEATIEIAKMKLLQEAENEKIRQEAARLAAIALADSLRVHEQSKREEASEEIANEAEALQLALEEEARRAEETRLKEIAEETARQEVIRIKELAAKQALLRHQQAEQLRKAAAEEAERLMREQAQAQAAEALPTVILVSAVQLVCASAEMTSVPPLRVLVTAMKNTGTSSSSPAPSLSPSASGQQSLASIALDTTDAYAGAVVACSPCGVDTVVLTLLEQAAGCVVGQVSVPVSSLQVMQPHTFNLPILEYSTEIARGPGTGTSTALDKLGNQLTHHISFTLTLCDRNSTMCGWVHKVSAYMLGFSQNMKRRWFVLYNGNLLYYSDEYSLESPKHIISCKDVTSITQDSFKGEQIQKLIYSPSGGKKLESWLYKYSADDSAATQALWVSRIAKSCSQIK